MSILKRVISLLLCVIMMVSVLSSCGEVNSHDNGTNKPTTEHSQEREPHESVTEKSQEGETDHTHTDTKPSEETTDGNQSHTHTPATSVTENVVEATCTQTGSYDEVIYCSACKEEISRTKKTVDKKPHEYSQKVTTPKYLKTEATCTDSAVYYYSCVCGEKGTTTFVSGNTLEHTFDRKNTSSMYRKSEATCTDVAVYYYSCICGEKGTTTFISGNTLEHTFDQKNTSSAYLKSEATCTENAVYYYSCICGEKGATTFVSSNTLEHTFDQKNTSSIYCKSDATCTSPAVYYYSCNCGEKGTTTFASGNTLEHTFDQKNTSPTYCKSEATCTAVAVYYYSCSCGAKGTTIFTSGTVLEHTFDQKNTSPTYCKNEATCTAVAVYYYSCICGKKGTTTFTSGTTSAHTFNQKNLSSIYHKSDATCTEATAYYYSCVCGEKGDEAFISGKPLGHSYNETVVENLPDGDSLGSTYQICSRCSYKNIQGLTMCSTCEGDGTVPGSQDCPKCINGYLLCDRCHGSGKEDKYTYPDTCNSCGGSGKWGSAGNPCIACDGTGERDYLYDCFQCDGDGTTGSFRCSNCNETGKITVEVNCTNCSGKGYHKHIEIQFDFLGGSNGPETQISTSNNLTISSTKPTKSGYKFVGWNTLENDQTIYQPGDTYTGDSTTFFAIWLPVCTECGGQGYFTNQSTCPSCDGVGSHKKDVYKCISCGTSNKINYIVGAGRVCNNCGSSNISYLGTKTIDCSGCVNGVSQNSTNCAACSATGCAKVIAPTLISKTGTKVELLLIEGMEYSLDGTTWQSSNVFTGLSPATNYTFYQRVANNGSVPFGATSDFLTVMTTCASEDAHNKNSKCVCTICGVEVHSFDEFCVCVDCNVEKHTLNRNCICINCNIEKHSVDAECICTKCEEVKHNLSAYCVCFGCGVAFHKFESDTCIVCQNSKTDWDGRIAESFECGSGTSSDPYIIRTGAQFAYLADQINKGNLYTDCYFELANDIDLKGIDWNPIGNGYNNYYFGGYFDGKGYVIKNLTITKSYKSVGLFGIIGKATLCNIGVENININSSYSSSESAVGGLVGFAQESTIYNCYTKGYIYGGNSSYKKYIYVGGLIGRVYDSSSIVNSYSEATVIGEKSSGYNAFVGGLIGIVDSTDASHLITIENCYTHSTVRAINQNTSQWAEAGGLIGLSNGYCMVNISNCFVECNIFAVGNNRKIDALVGNISYNNVSAINCYYVTPNVESTLSGVSVATTADFKSQAWLTGTLGWDFSNIWEINGNQYPTLKV